MGKESRRQVIALVAWIRDRYGNLGAADVLRVAQAEGIRTTYEEVFDVMTKGESSERKGNEEQGL